MSRPNITTVEAARCLELLESAAEPIVAAELACKLGLSGNHESQRRHVRELIKHLRDNGSQVAATLQEGYFLTDDPQDWRDYLEGRQIDAKKVLGEAHRRKRMLTDAGGQGLLFSQRIRCGVATCGA